MDSLLPRFLTLFAAGVLALFGLFDFLSYDPAPPRHAAWTVIFAVVLVPAMLTAALPRPLIYFWLPVPVLMYIWMIYQLEGPDVDGPESVTILAFAGSFMFVNAPVLLVRFAFLVAGARWNSGYIDRD